MPNMGHISYPSLQAGFCLLFKLTFRDVSLLSRAANSIQEGWFSCEGCFLSLKSQAGGFSGSSSEHLQHSFRFELLSKKSIIFWILLQSYFSFSKRTRSCETNSNLEVGFSFCCFVLLFSSSLPISPQVCSWSLWESQKFNLPLEGTSRNYTASFFMTLSCAFFCGTTEYPKMFLKVVFLFVSIFSEHSSTSIPGTCSHPYLSILREKFPRVWP